LQLGDGRDLLLELRRRLLVELDLDDPPLAVVATARVTSDRVQPRARRLGLSTTLQRRVGVEKRDLRQVLGVLSVPGEPEDGPEDLGAMSAD
jgi:hypothetical protein